MDRDGKYRVNNKVYGEVVKLYKYDNTNTHGDRIRDVCDDNMDGDGKVYTKQIH